MSTLPASGYLGNSGRTNAEMQTAFEDLRDFIVESVIGASARTELTISSGSVTPPDGASAGGGVFTIDTEGNAASDTLDAIVTTNTHDGQIIILMAENASRVVTLNSGSGSAGQFLLWDGVDFAFASLNSWVALQRRGTDWAEVMRFVPPEDLSSEAALTSSDLVEIWDDSAGTIKSTPATQLGHVVQAVEGTPGTSHSNISVVIPHDDTIPQNSEGSELVTVTITPKVTTNRLIIEWSLWGSIGSAGVAVAALFQDSTAGALAVAVDGGSAGDFVTLNGRHEMAAGTTSATTFKLRAGPSAAAANFYLIGQSGGRQFGGIAAVRLRVTEYAA